MKKRILSLFLLLSVLCLAACQGADTSATTKKPTETTTPPPEEPPEFVMEPGVPYYYNTHIFSPLPTNFALATEVANLQQVPDDWESNLRRSIYYIEEDVSDITFQFSGMELEGTYFETEANPITNYPLDFARQYIIEGYGSVFYDLKSGILSVIDFRFSSEIDKDPPAEKLTQEECREIAQAYIDDYIATYAPEIDLSDYTYREMDLQGYNQKFYNFVYDKYWNGRYLHGGALYCGVTEYGSVVVFQRGADYSALEEKADEIDLELYHAQLRTIAEKMLEKYPDSNLLYVIAPGYFQKTTDGTFIYHCGISFAHTDNPNSALAQLAFAIRLW